jgi:hypothetical protein
MSQQNTINNKLQPMCLHVECQLLGLKAKNLQNLLKVEYYLEVILIKYPTLVITQTDFGLSAPTANLEFKLDGDNLSF